MHSLPLETRQRLCQLGIEASLTLGKQLNLLLDAYDFYIQRYPPQSASDDFEIKDLQVSIMELGTLPHTIAAWLSDMRNGQSNVLSKEGFELHVLNEFAIHMSAIGTFMRRKHIDTSELDWREFASAIASLRLVNNKLST